MERSYWINAINQAFRVTPSIALLGPRQCGKTTLAKHFGKTHAPAHFFDLENPRDLERLKDPLLSLKNLSGLIIIDEIQYQPELFSALRVLIDEQSSHQRYLILGSASRELIKHSSESLAGRIYHLELPPFSFREKVDLEKLWIRGGFPLSYLADTEEVSFQWREQYIKTFLERDIPALGIKIPPQSLRRFWMMLTHCHGNIFNASDLAQSLGSNHTSMRHYLDILTGTFMMRSLQPWYENISKRQVKSPKVYFRDSGILHTLTGLASKEAILHHPKLGASWEGFAMEQVILAMKAESQDCYFWASQAHAELDLLIVKNGQRHGFEFKYQANPSTSRSMHIVLEDLKLEKLTVIHAGDEDYALTDRIFAQSLKSFLTQMV